MALTDKTLHIRIHPDIAATLTSKARQLHMRQTDLIRLIIAGATEETLIQGLKKLRSRQVSLGIKPYNRLVAACKEIVNDCQNA